MISLEQFLEALRIPLHGHSADAEQRDVIAYPEDKPLIVVAGPGTGKTTAIAARALKMVFVDKYDPVSIVLTTFTRRAAAELRSRVLGWGFMIRNELLRVITDADDLEYLRQLDINRFVTGTLDNLAETLLAEYRSPDIPSPVVLDQFVADGVLLTEGLFNGRLYEDPNLLNFARSHGYGHPNVRDLIQLSRVYCDRLRHDIVDSARFAACGSGQAAMSTVIDQYLRGLGTLGMMDFSGLEFYLLEQLRQGALSEFTFNLKAIFVDEFQDANILQEAIYYHIAREIGSHITVVGDDDQSLYRFRGGTVELFRDARSRMRSSLNLARDPDILYLTTNYRAPRLLVLFTRTFSECDVDYQPSRFIGKPPVHSDPDSGDGLPVLGVFRDNIEQLAESVARLCGDLFNGPGIDLPWNGTNIHVETSPDAQPGDCAFLAHSVREYSREFMGQSGTPRFPLHLRWQLASLPTPIRTFNPRGQLLSTVPQIAQLCGLMLECIDPNSIIFSSIATLPQEAVRIFRTWRTAAGNLIAQNPRPNRPSTLADFVRSWQQHRSQIDDIRWPSELPLIDLCYHLLTWIPALQDDPERQVHLEVVARAITETSTMNSYRSRIVFADQELKRKSVTQAIRNIFTPIALGDIEVNEDILETFPRTAINFLTVHQAKGLEFPIVIVDVGSQFKKDQWRQRGLRFPDRNSETYMVEDNTIPYGGLSTAPFAGWRDRAFDDLTRLYYVAYSRAQSLLVLAGLTSILPERNIPHVAMGWTRTRTSSWRRNSPYLKL